MESKLSSDIVQERKIIEQDFAEKRGKTPETIDRDRVLFLASSGEVAIAKSVIFERLKSNLSDEYMLETIALVETYEMDQHESEYWLNTLLQLFPNNEIGRVIRIIKSAEVSKKWEVVFEKSKVILSEDGGNWFALLAAAKSNAAIGDWEVSAK
ncbi:MAG: hypothetical protein VXZ89_05995, partial [Candidatus Thermoplasmatota archaeon]|nr:hypothetical protein [Candidatus Thermoplasmatota archaeon]